MRIRYKQLIRESSDELARLERKYRGRPVVDRIKMLRLLKCQKYSSRQQLAPVLGYSERQLHRWWKQYEVGGIPALLEEHSIGGSYERLTDNAREGLREAIYQGEIHSLRHVQDFLKNHFGIEYRSLQGISDLLKRHQLAIKHSRIFNRMAS